MITPAVLISACGSMILATATRLNRAMDRTRDVSHRFAELAESPGPPRSRRRSGACCSASWT
jgi:hypothetical protein